MTCKNKFGMAGALLLGAGIGVTMGFLYAPSSGQLMRRMIKIGVKRTFKANAMKATANALETRLNAFRKCA
jgi:hypothetical protein